MIAQNGKNIKKLLSEIPTGTIVTSKKLNSMGISYSLMRSYEKSGWIKRLAQGAYTKLNEVISLNGALYALQNDYNLSVHVGAFSALKTFYSKLHYVKDETLVHLFAPIGTKLPTWFKTLFCGQYLLHLTDFLPDSIGFEKMNVESFSIQVSSIERSLLEMLYLIPEQISVQEAYSVTETVMTLKTFLMQNLLENCSSIKVKRLLLCFAENAGLQWFDALDVQKIDLGNGVRSIERNGKLYQKYNLVIPELE